MRTGVYGWISWLLYVSAGAPDTNIAARIVRGPKRQLRGAGHSFGWTKYLFRAAYWKTLDRWRTAWNRNERYFTRNWFNDAGVRASITVPYRRCLLWNINRNRCHSSVPVNILKKDSVIFMLIILVREITLYLLFSLWIKLRVVFQNGHLPLFIKSCLNHLEK